MPKDGDVITLCGSTRFSVEMLTVQWELAKLGHVVLTWNLVPNVVGTDSHLAEKYGLQEVFDREHRRKIDLSDRIMVINVNDYIGESTEAEICYAIATDKDVEYVYPHTQRKFDQSFGVAMTLGSME